jgi:hypothetical protein
LAAEDLRQPLAELRIFDHFGWVQSEVIARRMPVVVRVTGNRELQSLGAVVVGARAGTGSGTAKAIPETQMPVVPHAHHHSRPR